MFNANNYGFNPYGRYGVQQPLQAQPIDLNNMLNRPILNGKQVDSLEAVRAADVPFDGSISYFPLTDGTAIITKQLQTDGTSKIVTYKPVDDNKKEVINFATFEDIQEAINDLDLSDIQDLKDDIKEMKKQLKELKNKKSEEE